MCGKLPECLRARGVEGESWGLVSVLVSRGYENDLPTLGEGISIIRVKFEIGVGSCRFCYSVVVPAG